MRTLIALVATASAILAAGETATLSYTVEWIGEMMRVHRDGDASPRMNLSEVAKSPGHFFAIGPVAGLRGEITAVDGEVFVATATDAAEHVTQTWDVHAPFLVHGRVDEWREVPGPAKAESIADVEAWLPGAATALGLDSEKPIPFKIEAPSSDIDYHIMANDAPGYQTTRPHKELQKPFALHGQAATMIGVYSTKHAGVFTHHGSSTHIHVVSGNKLHSGHVDRLSTGTGAKFFLPAP